MHSGQLGHTRIFMRPPRPSRPERPIRRNDQSLSSTTTKNPAVSGTPIENSNSLGSIKWAGVEAEAGAEAGAGAGRGANAARWQGGMSDRLDGEDAWSCCGRTVVAAGRGCEPKEPLAAVRKLLPVVLLSVGPQTRLQMFSPSQLEVFK